MMNALLTALHINHAGGQIPPPLPSPGSSDPADGSLSVFVCSDLLLPFIVCRLNLWGV